MQIEPETEYKFLVSDEQFNKYFALFVEKYGKAATKLQVNYYYDTEDNLLNKNDVTVRVRQGRDKLKWQIKKHSGKCGALFSSDEYSGSVEELPRFLTVDGVNEELLLKGSLVTERRVINFGVSGKLCFDISMYLGVIDYEIEIEYLEQDKPMGDAIAAVIDSNMASTTTKSDRFIKRWEEINNGKSKCSQNFLIHFSKARDKK